MPDTTTSRSVVAAAALVDTSATDAQVAKQAAELDKLQKELKDRSKEADESKKAVDDFKVLVASLQKQLKEAQQSAGGAAPAAAAAAAPVADNVSSRGMDAAAAAPAPESSAFKVVVHTSEVSGGAFDGEVYVVLYGTGYNSSGEIKLSSDRNRCATVRAHSQSCASASAATRANPDERCVLPCALAALAWARPTSSPSRCPRTSCPRTTTSRAWACAWATPRATT